MKSKPEQNKAVGNPSYKKPSHTPFFGRGKFKRVYHVAFPVIRSLNLGVEIGVGVDLPFLDDLDDLVHHGDPLGQPGPHVDPEDPQQEKAGRKDCKRFWFPHGFAGFREPVFGN